MCARHSPRRLIARVRVPRGPTVGRDLPCPTEELDVNRDRRVGRRLTQSCDRVPEVLQARGIAVEPVGFRGRRSARCVRVGNRRRRCELVGYRQHLESGARRDTALAADGRHAHTPAITVVAPPVVRARQRAVDDGSCGEGRASVRTHIAGHARFAVGARPCHRAHTVDNDPRGAEWSTSKFSCGAALTRAPRFASVPAGRRWRPGRTGAAARRRDRAAARAGVGSRR